MRQVWTAWSYRRAGRRRRSGAAAKASAGAVAHVKIAEVVNIARSLEELKDLGVWTVGLAGEAPTPYDAIDFSSPTAIVLGAEGQGLRRLVRDKCDLMASIPMHGHVGSINVSVAAGVVLFEAVRQRRRSQDGRQPIRKQPGIQIPIRSQMIEAFEVSLDDLSAALGRSAIWLDKGRGCSAGTGSAIICSLSGWRSSGR